MVSELPRATVDDTGAAAEVLSATPEATGGIAEGERLPS